MCKTERERRLLYLQLWCYSKIWVLRLASHGPPSIFNLTHRPKLVRIDHQTPRHKYSPRWILRAQIMEMLLDRKKGPWFVESVNPFTFHYFERCWRSYQEGERETHGRNLLYSQMRMLMVSLEETCDVWLSRDWPLRDLDLELQSKPTFQQLWMRDVTRGNKTHRLTSAIKRGRDGGRGGGTSIDYGDSGIVGSSSCIAQLVE